MEDSDLKEFVKLTLDEARAPIVGIAPEVQELLSVRGRRGIMHFASSMTYQLNLIVGYSLNGNVNAEQLKDICVQNKTKRYILVSVPDVVQNMVVVDVDNILSLTNFITAVKLFGRLKDKGKIDLSAKSIREAYQSFRVIKHFVKSPVSVIQFRFVQALRRVGIDIIKGSDPFGTKLIIINANIIRTIYDMQNPYFRSSAGRPKEIDHERITRAEMPPEHET